MSINKTGLGAKLMQKGGAEWKDFKLLMRSVPSAMIALCVVSVVLMNLLANKEIHTGISWLALDAGFLVSWLSFLVMDIVTKRFGPKAAIQISVFAEMVNLLVCGVFVLAAAIPGNWGVFYDYGMTEVNSALDATIGGTWYVVAGSAIAFLVSSVVNALTNASIGKLTTRNNFGSFACRSYVSTLIAQFVDNMVFSLIVSHVFFGWTLIQCVTCSVTGCAMELLCEVLFSPIGYKVSKQWEVENVGKEYINARKDDKI